jgi:hypothetical protein
VYWDFIYRFWFMKDSVLFRDKTFFSVWYTISLQLKFCLVFNSEWLLPLDKLDSIYLFTGYEDNSKFITCLSSMSVSSLCEFPEKGVYRHGVFNCFIKYLHRKLPISLLWYWKCLKNVHLLNLYFKTIIFLFCNYIHVFNSSQND